MTEFLTLDGVYEDSAPWQRDYSPDDGQIKRDELFDSDALLLGRLTYEGFVKYWPTATGTGDFGERMNSLPKFVATTTLKSLEGNVAKAVAALEVGGERQYPRLRQRHLSPDTVASRISGQTPPDGVSSSLGERKASLVGKGKLPLKLASSRDLGSGVMLLIYQPATRTWAVRSSRLPGAPTAALIIVRLWSFLSRTLMTQASVSLGIP